jgi:hypothetical protein
MAFMPQRLFTIVTHHWTNTTQYGEYPRHNYNTHQPCDVLNVNGVIRGIFASEIVHYIYGIIGHATLRHDA